MFFVVCLPCLVCTKERACFLCIVTKKAGKRHAKKDWHIAQMEGLVFCACLHDALTREAGEAYQAGKGKQEQGTRKRKGKTKGKGEEEGKKKGKGNRLDNIGKRYTENRYKIAGTARPRKRHKAGARHKGSPAPSLCYNSGQRNKEGVFSIFCKPHNFPFLSSCFISHPHFPLFDPRSLHSVAC